MRKALTTMTCAVLLASCGDGGSGGTTGGTSVTPTPSPTPTPTPAPTPTYKKFSELTGDQNFKTACSGIQLNTAPPTALPATAYTDGLLVAYASAPDSYTFSGGGVAASFGPADIDTAAPTTVKAYKKTVGANTERFTLGVPVAGATPTASGTSLEYARGFNLTTAVGGTLTQFGCVLGVPTLATDVPSATTITFAKVGINGVAYVNEAGVQKVYAVNGTTGSTATLSGNTTTGKVTITIQLVGTQQGATPAVTGVPLGNYTTVADTDTSKPSFYGMLTSTDRNSVFSYIGGWFFGPQGAEAASSFEIATLDPATGARMTVTGNLIAIK